MFPGMFLDVSFLEVLEGIKNVIKNVEPVKLHDFHDFKNNKTLTDTNEIRAKSKLYSYEHFVKVDD